ncbi:MAG TPA: hypothetical protein PLJ08_07820 [Cyclobacteriaceae bacterium]|nr:hypothetical protein [Cyclobacteriaceae bacterium]
MLNNEFSSFIHFEGMYIKSAQEFQKYFDHFRVFTEVYNLNVTFDSDNDFNLLGHRFRLKILIKTGGNSTFCIFRLEDNGAFEPIESLVASVDLNDIQHQKIGGYHNIHEGLMIQLFKVLKEKPFGIRYTQKSN